MHFSKTLLLLFSVALTGNAFAADPIKIGVAGSQVAQQGCGFVGLSAHRRRKQAGGDIVRTLRCGQGVGRVGSHVVVAQHVGVLTSSPWLKPGDSLHRTDSKGTSGLRK